MTPASKGIGALVLACAIWGLSPLFYKRLADVPPLELLSHRTLWSLAVFSIVLLLQGRIGMLLQVLKSKQMVLVLAMAALMISTNWFLFIWAIQIGRTTEASLGYYIFPLVAVVIGRVAFGERLSGLQVAAIVLVCFAVALLTFGLGVVPWIAIVLASTFGFYGLVKKRLDIGPVVSVTAEVALLAPVAIAVLINTHSGGGGAFGRNALDTVLLVLAGPMTAVPLILFSYATRRVAMATVGLVQFLNPTLQFVCAVLVFAEPFGHWHAIAFGLIWTALALYSVSAIAQDRTARRASVSSAGVAITEKKSDRLASAKP